VIEVPRPHTEGGTLEAAVRAFETLSARAIIIAGAAPDANADRSADVLRTVNAQSLFSLAHQVILRETAHRPGVVMQVRAIPTRPEQLTPTEDAVLALDSVAKDRSALEKPVADLLTALERAGMRVRLGTGESVTAGLDATAGPQAAYMSQTKSKRFAVLWISPLVRHALGQDAVLAQRRQFAALGISTIDADAAAYIATRRMSSSALPAAWRQKAERYLESADIVSLNSLQRDFEGLLLERVDDINGRGALLLVSSSDGSLRGVLALSTMSGARGAVKFVEPGLANARDVADFLASGATWMSVR